MKRKRWAVLVGAIVVAAVSLALALQAGGGDRLVEVHQPWLEIPASEVEFRTLEGGSASVADYVGRVVVLNFWGTWCPPCRREMPELVELHEALGETGTVVGIAVHSPVEEIRDFAAEFGVDFPIWLSDPQKGLAHFDASGYPFTILIDEGGVVRKQYLGPQTAETLAGDIERLTGRSVALPGRG